MWICPKCKIELDDSVQVCPKCGYIRLDSETPPAASPPQSAPADDSNKPGQYTWKYSGKSFRAWCALNWILTLLFLGLGFYLMFTERMGNYPTVIWAVLLLIPVLSWLWFFSDYLYKTMFIQYRLTESHLYFEQGFLHRTIDTMELIGINDLKMRQTLFDRVLNGGVGTVVVFSVSDKTDSELPMKGLENPQQVLEAIDGARRKLRARGFVQM